MSPRQYGRYSEYSTWCVMGNAQPHSGRHNLKYASGYALPAADSPLSLLLLDSVAWMSCLVSHSALHQVLCTAKVPALALPLGKPLLQASPEPLPSARPP